MRVVVAGLGKSGTTALVYAIKSAMPADTELLFEPRDCVALQAENVAAKVLLNPLYPMDAAFFRQFGKIVLLVRDPRDVLISMSLYRVRKSKALDEDAGKLEEFLNLLRAKEANPRSVSLTQVIALFDKLAGARPLQGDEGIRSLLGHALAFHDTLAGCLVYPYEKMVKGEFGELGEYLALPAAAMQPEVPRELRHVVRSKRSGNWQDWFCAEDVEHYRPLMAQYMNRYGYADDWKLGAEPVILAEECSDYVMRLVRERRESGIAANR